MKKTQFDAITKAIDWVNTASQKVAELRDTVHTLSDEVNEQVQKVLSETKTKLEAELEDSPLEDPVVPTSGATTSAGNWSGATDQPNKTDDSGPTINEMKEYILEQGRRVGDENFSDVFKVNEMSDANVRKTYKFMQLANSILDRFKLGD